MNQKFYNLPKEKQLAIINAGFLTFSDAPYSKGSISRISSEADISKSLLFFYFKNKKEYYLYLVRQAIEITQNYLKENSGYEGEDIFSVIQNGMRVKIAMLKDYPAVSGFTMRAYTEKDPEVASDIQLIINEYGFSEGNEALFKLDPNLYAPGIDLKMMYTTMYYATEGYLQEQLRKGPLDVKETYDDISEMIDFWKSVYGRK